MANSIYDEMCREADRMIHDKNEADEVTPLNEIEKRIDEHAHDAGFYFNCGIAAANVCNDVWLNGSCEEMNEACGGLDAFTKRIGLS